MKIKLKENKTKEDINNGVVRGYLYTGFHYFNFVGSFFVFLFFFFIVIHCLELFFICSSVGLSEKLFLPILYTV